MSDALKKNENFFLEGSGKALLAGDTGKLSLIHLQDMTLELSSKMEDIFGGESNMPVFQYQSEKSVKATFTNASMSLDMFNASQGVGKSQKATLFTDEEITVGADGGLTLKYDTADMETLKVFDESGNLLEVTDGKVAETYAGKTVNAVYNYTTDVNAVGSDMLTTSVPGYVVIHHKSKPVQQKNGRIIRVYTTIYKARCDGSLKLDFKHKNAFAPELTFNGVDPERKDGKFMSFTVVDVTDEEKDNNNVTASA